MHIVTIPMTRDRVARGASVRDQRRLHADAVDGEILDLL